MIWGAAQTLRDLDRRLALEHMRDELTHHINHELRGPATSLVMALSLLKDDKKPLDDEQRAIVEAGLRSAEHLKRMTDDLLDVTRLETGKLRVEIKRIDAGAVLGLCADSVRSAAASRGVSLAYEAPPALFVHADPIRMRQVVCNLLDNAIKFTPAEGSIRLRAERDGVDLLVTVADTGPGIPAVDLERIFDRLYQSQRTAQKGALGLGLGLAICRELIGRQGGRIWAESEPGQGSLLRFTLPAA